jgi:DUF4097 and DUF4098 domain-containing protein YvlB
MKKASIFTIMGLLLYGICQASPLSSDSTPRPVQPVPVCPTDSINKKFELGNLTGKDVVIKDVSGSIKIVGHSSQSYGTANAFLLFDKSNESKYKYLKAIQKGLIKVKRTHQKVIITTRVPQSLKSNESFSITLHLPEHTTYEVRGSCGILTVEKMRGKGIIRDHTGSRNLWYVRGDLDIDAFPGSTNVSFDRIHAGKLTINQCSGKIDFFGCKNLNATLGVTVEKGRINIRSKYKGLLTAVRHGAGMRLNGQLGSGSVQVLIKLDSGKFEINN